MIKKSLKNILLRRKSIKASGKHSSSYQASQKSHNQAMRTTRNQGNEVCSILANQCSPSFYDAFGQLVALYNGLRFRSKGASSTITST